MTFPKKLQSRKFWLTLMAAIAGLIVLVNGAAAGEKFAIIAGAALAIAVALGYVKAEKDIDAARIVANAKKPQGQ